MKDWACHTAQGKREEGGERATAKGTLPPPPPPPPTAGGVRQLQDHRLRPEYRKLYWCDRVSVTYRAWRAGLSSGQSSGTSVYPPSIPQVNAARPLTIHCYVGDVYILPWVGWNGAKLIIVQDQ